MINGAGATPLMELFIINNHVADVLAAKGISVYRTLVGEYMTSIEMQGFSISLLKLDDRNEGAVGRHGGYAGVEGIRSRGPVSGRGPDRKEANRKCWRIKR